MILYVQVVLFQWDSFKAALHISAKPTKLQPRSKSMRKASMNSRYDDAYPKHDLSRTESFNLIDYTSQTLAEQLTLLEQVNYHFCFLDGPDILHQFLMYVII